MDPKNIRSVTDFDGSSSDDEVVDESDVEEGVNIFPTSRIPDTSSSISETNSDVFNTNFPITGATTPVTNSDATTPFDTTPFETVPFTTPIDEDEDDDGDNAKFETKLKLPKTGLVVPVSAENPNLTLMNKFHLYFKNKLCLFFNSYFSFPEIIFVTCTFSIFLFL